MVTLNNQRKGGNNYIVVSIIGMATSGLYSPGSLLWLREVSIHRREEDKKPMKVFLYLCNLDLKMESGRLMSVDAR